MKERPILFSGPMVRALLEGSKTQTRRVAKLTDAGHVKEPGGHRRWHTADPNAGLACPYGQPGDRLWVRETWGYIDPDCSGQDVEGENDDGMRGGPCRVFHDDMMREGSALRDYWRRRVAYAASWQEPKFGNGPDAPKRWRPSIHMPRWASRITLEVTAVRVERLQNITRGDAMSEGCPFPNMAKGDDPRTWYAGLWNAINGRESWDLNQWVWVVEFKRATP